MCGTRRERSRAICPNLGARLAPYILFKYIPHITHTLLLKQLCIIFICATLNIQGGHCKGLQLSDHIRHFEPVFYDRLKLKSNHRTKRDTSQFLNLDFTAHNREFKIRLKPDRSVFAEDVLLESTNGPVKFDFSKIYAGTLEDDHLVEVSGIIDKDGIFDGHIATTNELYYMEPSKKYIPNAEFHSVIYKASDVSDPSPARCASQQLHLKGKVHNPWVDVGQKFESGGPLYGPVRNKEAIHSQLVGIREKGNAENAKISSNDVKIVVNDVPSNKTRHRFRAVNSINTYRQYPMDEASDSFKNELLKDGISLSNEHLKKSHEKRHFRQNRYKRAIIDSKKTTCMLYLQADHLFYNEEGSEEACIDKITRHVQRVNNIYKVTDFNRDGKPDNIGFMIKRIKIHNMNATKDPGYRFPGNYGVEKYLELFSEEDYDAFCLAYMFTYRDFEGGTLGLAWTGDLKNAGGVCEKNGHYRGSLKSLNTGIVTLLNYGKKVPPAVSHVTLAHEIGHNFGSPHDPEKDLRCTPGGENGNYIMFARATSGDKQNNNKFSPCSLKQINNVLNSKARDSKGCFTEPQTAICGNGVVEEGEQCDCGWQEDCDETCCYPMVSNPKSHEKPCTLKPSRICSPSQGPCCTQSCQLKQDDLCRDDNGCRAPSFCDGMSPYCPPSINKPNKTICKEEFVCFKGECTGSICLAYGLESCQCSRRSRDPETKSCELCCKLPGPDQTCISSFEWNDRPFNIPDMYAKPGTPCDNYKGYCDVFQKCREVDPSGPLATLREILLSNKSLVTLQRWIMDNWYAILLLIFCLILILGIILRICGKQTKKGTSKRTKRSKSKSNVIVHKNSASSAQFMTVVSGNADGTNHVVHPTVVRANIPFKRKVNEVRRAATKAKRVAKSQLGRPYKNDRKRRDGTITSPTDSENSQNFVSNGKVSSSPRKSRSNNKISSRLSVISFKAFRPNVKSVEKNRVNSSSKKRSSPKTSKTKGSPKNISPERKKLNPALVKKKDKEEKIKKKDSKLDNVKIKKEPKVEDKKKKEAKTDKKNKKILAKDPISKDRVTNKNKRSKDKPVPKKATHDKTKKRRSVIAIDKKAYDGNWLINKFLADEENVPKPLLSDSLSGSINSAINESPLLSHQRSDSKRGLISNPKNSTSIKGIVNAAFISSPRFPTRTHSSLRIGKAFIPKDFGVGPSKYRRSISLEAHSQFAPDKRKRTCEDGYDSSEKRKRLEAKIRRKSSTPTDIIPQSTDNSCETTTVDSPSSHDSINVPEYEIPENLPLTPIAQEKQSIITDKSGGTPTVILIDKNDLCHNESGDKRWV